MEKKIEKVVEYYKGEKIKFEGEYLNDIKWKGKGFNENGEVIYEINNGKKTSEEDNSDDELSEQSI